MNLYVWLHRTATSHEAVWYAHILFFCIGFVVYFEGEPDLPLLGLCEKINNLFLPSQDVLEVMYVSDWLSVSTDFTDVTPVSKDTYI